MTTDVDEDGSGGKNMVIVAVLTISGGNNSVVLSKMASSAMVPFGKHMQQQQSQPCIGMISRGYFLEVSWSAVFIVRGGRPITVSGCVAFGFL
mmetsp:Transcript_14501/g.40345  ORF Transcript_14501/g.40345 Transcript_14501/m.40345 type:complete len:93 (-) Transcript_14501:719-997(-)